MRDSKTGKFLPGHECLSVRDPQTGKFVSRKITIDTKTYYQEVREAVDEFLENYGSVGC